MTSCHFGIKASQYFYRSCMIRLHMVDYEIIWSFVAEDSLDMVAQLFASAYLHSVDKGCFVCARYYV